jgi:hypothetical protein
MQRIVGQNVILTCGLTSRRVFFNLKRIFDPLIEVMLKNEDNVDLFLVFFFSGSHFKT